MTKPEERKGLPATVEKPAPVSPAGPRIVYRLSCGTGPCKAVRIVEGTSRRVEDGPALPPAKDAP